MANIVIDGKHINIGDRPDTPELREKLRTKLVERTGSTDTSRPPRIRSERQYSNEQEKALSKTGVGTYEKMKAEYDIRTAFLDEARKARELLATGKVNTGPWIGAKTGAGESERPGRSWILYQGMNPEVDQMVSHIDAMEGLAIQLAIQKFGKVDSNPAQKLIDQMMRQFSPRIDREADTNINRIDTSTKNLMNDLADIKRRYDKGRELGYVPEDAAPLTIPEITTGEVNTGTDWESVVAGVLGKGSDFATSPLGMGVGGAYGGKKILDQFKKGAKEVVKDMPRQPASVPPPQISGRNTPGGMSPERLDIMKSNAATHASREERIAGRGQPKIVDRSGRPLTRTPVPPGQGGYVRPQVATEAAGKMLGGVGRALTGPGSVGVGLMTHAEELGGGIDTHEGFRSTMMNELSQTLPRLQKKTQEGDREAAKILEFLSNSNSEEEMMQRHSEIRTDERYSKYIGEQTYEETPSKLSTLMSGGMGVTGF